MEVLMWLLGFHILRKVYTINCGVSIDEKHWNENKVK